MPRARKYPVTVTAKVSEETAKRIRELSEEMGIRPSTLIRELLTVVVRSIARAVEQDGFVVVYLDYPILVISKD
jgi:DNA-binding LacI/PurR family transcriptional regulator